jgi:hypothetical protein
VQDALDRAMRTAGRAVLVIAHRWRLHCLFWLSIMV